MEGVHRKEKITHAARGKAGGHSTDLPRIPREIAVGDNLAVRHADGMRGTHDRLNGVRIKERLTAKGHDGFKAIGRRDPHDRIGGRLRGKIGATGAMIPLRAVAALPRAGIGHDKFQLF